MSHPRRIAVLLPLLLALLTTAALAQGVLRLGLNEDPDALDPARSGTFVGRIVFAATCDKLIDTDAHEQLSSRSLPPPGRGRRTTWRSR